MTSAARQILSLNAFGEHSTKGLQPDVAALVERRRKSFGAGSVLFYDEPLHIVRAEGAWLHASDGRAYLDFYNNVPTVGHCHPKVVEAVQRQVATLNIHSRYLFDVAHDYAEKAKVAIRHVRRDGMDDLKKAEKDGDIGQDLSRSQSEKVQKMTDDVILDVDRLLAEKEKEIMQV